MKDKTFDVNSDVLEGKWNQLKGHVREKWGDLTDDDVDRISGRYDILIGTLQEKYGYSRAEAERDANDFLANY